MKGLIRRHIIASIIKKEFAQVLRDPRMRNVLLAAPLVMLVILGYAVNMDVNLVRIAVLDEEKSQISRSIIEKFTGSGYFVIHSYLLSEKELSPLMDRATIEAYLHIGKGLSKKIKTGRTAEIQVIIDGTDSNRAAIISAYVNEIMQMFFIDEYMKRIKSTVLFRAASMPGAANDAAGSSGFVMSKGVRVIDRVFYNPTISSRNYFLPGIIAFLVSLITIMLTSMSIVKERESGTMEQITVSPIRPMEFILGKTIPFAVIGFMDMFLVTLITIFWFNVPFKGNIIFLFIAGLFYILSTLSVGIYISTISRTQQQALMSFFMFFLPAILFSGFAFPIYTMPEIIQIITYLNPLMYFIVIIRGVFLKGVGIALLWKELAILIVIGILLMSISARRLSKRLE